MAGERIVVNLNEMTLREFESARQVLSFDCVTGSKDHPTEPGTFRILRKSPKQENAQTLLEWASIGTAVRIEGELT
jgi:hypothetical protein